MITLTNFHKQCQYHCGAAVPHIQSLLFPLKNHPSESLTIYLCQTTTTTTVRRDKQGRGEKKKMGGGEGGRQKSRPYDISKWCCGDFFEGDEIGNK